MGALSTQKLELISASQNPASEKQEHIFIHNMH